MGDSYKDNQDSVTHICKAGSKNCTIMTTCLKFLSSTCMLLYKAQIILVEKL